MLLFVLLPWEKRPSLSQRRKIQKLEFTFLSVLCHCLRSPSGEIVQCMTQLNAFYCTRVPKSLAAPDWLKDWSTKSRRRIFSSIIPRAVFAVCILERFCISEAACLLTTVVNIGRGRYHRESTRLCVASCTIISECTRCVFVTVLHCNVLTCQQDGACIHSNILFLYHVNTYWHTTAMLPLYIVAYVCVWCRSWYT